MREKELILQKSSLISQDMVDALSGLFGDKNPIHLEDSYARKKGFERPIVHGAILNAIVSNLVGNDFPGHGSVILNSSAKYVKPVFVKDLLKLNAYVLYHSKALSVYDMRIDIMVERPKYGLHKVAVFDVRVMCKS
ncbi:MaoC/PaaZ C-terminal domain-containing protein [Alphaproteobacteria bacterium]|nr:MaoC/PaaZ C-terminal domain-containing protein [Alphaproteobacteria bacterium]